MHALTGANGAGKSTLMNLLAGVHAPSAGEILIDGIAVRFASPAEARAAGIAAVYQELARAAASSPSPRTSGSAASRAHARACSIGGRCKPTRRGCSRPIACRWLLPPSPAR